MTTIIEKVIITKMMGLNHPIYRWDLTNSVGGGFSNSGQFKSKNKCIMHAKAMIHNYDSLEVEYKEINLQEIK